MDKDVKIAPKNISKVLSHEERIAEDITLDYIFHKKSGNIHKAYLLGSELAEETIANTSIITEANHNKALAFSLYLVVTLLKENIKNNIVLNTIIAEYYSKIELLDAKAWDYIVSSGDLSLYYHIGIGEAVSSAEGISAVPKERAKELLDYFTKRVVKLIADKNFLA